MRVLFKIKGIVCFLFFVIYICVVSLPVEAFYPLEKTYWRSSNFGEFRSIKYLHDGTDISAPPNSKIYAIKNGIIEEIKTGYNKGYGTYIIIKHNDGTYSRYCHLSSIGYNAIQGRVFQKNDPVQLDQVIAYSGESGMAKGHPHLHFEYWNSQGRKIDPISGTSTTDGLDQPNNGEAYLYDGPRYRRGRKLKDTTNGINLVTPGINGIFDGKDDELWGSSSGDSSIIMPYLKDGEPVRIVIEAYDKIFNERGEKKEMTTVPNKVYLKITDSDGNIVQDRWGKNSEHWIDFSKISFGSDPSRAYLPNISEVLKETFSTTNPLGSESLGITPKYGRIYLYWKWYPKEEKRYKLHIDVYDAYRENGRLVSKITDSREVNLSLGIFGWDYRDDVYAVSIKKEPEILFSRADPTYFSPNSTIANLPNRVSIYARANKNVNWTVNILDQSLNTIKSFKVGSGEELRTIWDGTDDNGWKVSDGRYTYQVLADSGGENAYYDGEDIEVDTQASVISSIHITDSFNIISTQETTVVNFSANEDLYSAKIDILDEQDNEVLTLGYIPGVFANETENVRWEFPGYVPNGTYKFKVTATDIAGNESSQTSPAVTVNVPNNTALPFDSPSQPNLLDLPPPQRPPNNFGYCL